MRWRAVLRSLVMFVALAVAAASTTVRAECRLERGSAHAVTKVIDSETLGLDDGTEVRLVGALAPRARDAAGSGGQWPAEAAAAAALESLVAGQTIQLKFGGERRDRHGRWLAHAFVKAADGSETWVQTALLRAGHAQAYAIQGNRACIDELAEAEAVARGEGRGLWAVPTYRVRQSLFPRDLVGGAGQFRIVTGTVRFVSNRREGYRLWLDAEGRRGEITIAIRSNDRELIGSLGGDMKALTKRKIEVRGWLDQRRGSVGGPEIDVSTAGMIRLVSQ